MYFTWSIIFFFQLAGREDIKKRKTIHFKTVGVLKNLLKYVVDIQNPLGIDAMGNVLWIALNSLARDFS